MSLTLAAANTASVAKLWVKYLTCILLSTLAKVNAMPPPIIISSTLSKRFSIS